MPSVSNSRSGIVSSLRDLVNGKFSTSETIAAPEQKLFKRTAKYVAAVDNVTAVNVSFYAKSNIEIQSVRYLEMCATQALHVVDKRFVNLSFTTSACCLRPPSAKFIMSSTNDIKDLVE